MAKEYIKLWKSYAAYFEPLGAAEVGRLVLTMMEYESAGTASKLNGNERYIWPMIRAKMDEDKAADAAFREKQSQKAKKRWGKQDAAASHGIPRHATACTGIDKKENPLSFPPTPPYPIPKEKISSSAHAREEDIYTGLVDGGMAAISEAYESNIGLISPAISESMRVYREKMQPECVIEAIHTACNNNARNWAYVRAILDNKLAAGVTTMEQWRAHEVERQSTKSSRGQANGLDAVWEDGGEMNRQEFTEFWQELKTLYPYDYRTDSAVAMWVGAMRSVPLDKAKRALRTHHKAYPKKAPLPDEIVESATKYGGAPSLMHRAIEASRGEKDAV